jgi:hypothetical protein
MPLLGAHIVALPGSKRAADVQVRFGCAPCKGGAFQWVQAPPGNRSSRKQSEQSWRYEVAEAFD